MKRSILAAALALCVAVATEQQASAWDKLNFGAGFKVCYESGGTNYSRHYNRTTASAPAPWASGGMGPEMGGYPAPPMPAPAPAPMPKEKDNKNGDAAAVGYYSSTPYNNGYGSGYGYYPANYGYNSYYSYYGN